MPYDVIDARYIAGHKVWLRFRDGTEGEVDLSSALHGSQLAPLQDANLFRTFGLHPEFHTLVWPNGADLAPEFLHHAVSTGAGTRA